MRTLPLTSFSSRELDTLLQEEVRRWDEELSWDYSDVSAAVAAGLDRGSLAGRVAEEASGPAAYCYYIQDAGRAVVGSLFASAEFRDRGYEEALLDVVLCEAQGASSNSRVECQTLFSTASGADALFERSGFSSRSRHYLVRDLAEPLPASATAFRLRAIRRDDLGQAADIIFRSHEGSLDAALNLTYSSLGHCRSFVDTLVLRGGCGRFDVLASCIAEQGGEPVGVLVASQLSRSNGHVCQVSVLPGAQARGCGSALMAQALEAFRRQGLSTASLSVTVENAGAYRLYERLGFRLRKAFAAHAWVRPPAKIELPA